MSGFSNAHCFPRLVLVVNLVLMPSVPFGSLKLPALGCIVTRGKTPPPLASAFCIPSSSVSPCSLRDCITIGTTDISPSCVAFWRVDNSVCTFLPIDPISLSLMGKAYELRCIKHDYLKSSSAAVQPERESLIYLINRPGLHEIWRGSLPIPNFCFSKLDTLIVDYCPFLSDAVLPFHLLPLLPQLKTLEVRYCDSVKTIFDVKPSTLDTLVTLPLNNLVLSNLPNLENVWNKDPPHGILCMQHLKKVKIKECESLTSVFPASVAKDLKLEDLVIEECERLAAIVAEDNTDPNLQLTLPCPYLRSLKLLRLQKFAYFYYCSHKSDIYTPLESPTEHQLPNEKCMSVGENGMKMILRGEFERKLLESLKALTLCFGSDVFGCKILEEVPNIEKLVVCDGSFKEMFSCESGNNVLQQLKVLRLEFLGELVSIGLENSWTDSFVRNLETFEVIRCWSLKNLVASTVSFSNLMCLNIYGCLSLSYLLTSSTAKRLGQLRKMKIQYCNSIEEIVSKDKSDEDEITFPKLTCLNLDWLPNLKRFYRGSLGFPSLEELSVIYCHEMITLCAGSIEACNLSQVKLDPFSKAIQLETDLNSTMRKEYLREISELRNLDLESRPGLQEIWYGSLHIPDLCFSEMATLIVDDCQFLSDAVLPFRLLPLLPKLETLEVRNCDYVKTIFDVECTTKDTLITLPLKKLTLYNLSNLKNVWNKDPHGILRIHHLRQVHVTKCKDLTSVFPTSVAKDLWNLDDLVVEDCKRLIVIVANEYDEDEEIIFEWLKVLELKRLQELRCFYAGNFTLSFPSLKEVHVIECGSMRTFSAVNKIDHLTKWYYSEDAKESDLNYGVRRTSEEEVAVIKGRLKGIKSG
ncbi:uncharacterized protein LOC111240754 [Vigna radiata var. radiata]|uniref:Uncharacterized protein LOC111240754 n=1 Tax=Vigna radiata var. radiata TaxID=3916 RepID=A0A3Q0EM00_VIGRR|nr:uncharacterized protein LOC111240754 [Vigna radiata var. radiata]